MKVNEEPIVMQHDHHEHKTPVQEWLKAGLLIGLGVYFIYIIASGTLTNYINIRFAWLSYVAVILFLILGVASVYRLLQPHHHDHHEDHDHHHGTISWAVLGVIAVPLVLGTLIPSRPLGAAAVDGDLSRIGGDVTTAFSIAPEDRNILDWVRAFNAADDMAAFNGLPVDITGFVFRDDTFAGNQFLAARFTISCCVADSMAIGVPVVADETYALDTWVHVRGQLRVEEFRGEERPVIHPDSIEVVEQPAHPYLYP